MGEPLNHIHQDTKSTRLIAVCKRSLRVSGILVILPGHFFAFSLFLMRSAIKRHSFLPALHNQLMIVSVASKNSQSTPYFQGYKIIGPHAAANHTSDLRWKNAWSVGHGQGQEQKLHKQTETFKSCNFPVNEKKTNQTSIQQLFFETNYFRKA